MLDLRLRDGGGVAAATLLVILATACTTGDGRDPQGTGTGLFPTETGGNGDGDGDGDGDDDGGQQLFDVGGGAGDGTGGDQGCEKVDFMFVLDASPSMEQEQEQLIAAFPQFIDTIQTTLQAQDYHIMVVDTDAHPQYTPKGGNGFCEDGGCCPQVCGQDPQANWCQNEPCADHSGDCDFTLGAGKNDDADWESCGVDGDRRWLTQDDPDLEQSFECVARVGTYGHYQETQGAAIVEAASPELNAGGCNDGFLRDDAVLVVTLITDEEDQSPGVPHDWFETLVQAKGGNPNNIVMLGLVGDFGQQGSPCLSYDQGGAQYAKRLLDFVGLFGARGLQGSVCEDDYGPFFEQAVSLIDTACEEFVPPG